MNSGMVSVVQPTAPVKADISYDTATAYQQGKNEAVKAWVALNNLGFGNATGTPVVYDLEVYPNNSACRAAVKSFLQGWIDQMRVPPAQVAGVYGSSCTSYSMILPHWRLHLTLSTEPTGRETLPPGGFTALTVGTGSLTSASSNTSTITGRHGMVFRSTSTPIAPMVRWRRVAIYHQAAYVCSRATGLDRHSVHYNIMNHLGVSAMSDRSNPINDRKAALFSTRLVRSLSECSSLFATAVFALGVMMSAPAESSDNVVPWVNIPAEAQSSPAQATAESPPAQHPCGEDDSQVALIKKGPYHGQVTKDLNQTVSSRKNFWIRDNRIPGEVASENALLSDPTFAELKTALKESGNGQAAFQKLIEQLREHPETIGDFLSVLQSETDPNLTMLLAHVIAENPAMAKEESVFQAALDLSQNSDPQRRQTGLILLSSWPETSPELVQMVTQISREDVCLNVRHSAITVMGSWMNLHPEMISQLSQELLRTADTSEDSVRGYIIQTIALQKELPEEILKKMVEYLKQEINPHHRALAALALGEASQELKPFALEQLERAYEQETDLETKRHLLTQMVRVGGNDSVEILRRIPPGDSLLAQDIQDYLEIMGNGATDPDEIYRNKTSRDAERGTLIGLQPQGTKAPPEGLTVVDDPNGDEAAPDVVRLGADCGGIFNPCGIVNNRTDRWLEACRDSASRLYCDPRGPYGWVAPGRNSNQNPPGFKDTDCFRSTECSVFYGGILHPPGDWVRIRNSVFVYSLGC